MKSTKIPIFSTISAIFFILALVNLGFSFGMEKKNGPKRAEARFDTLMLATKTAAARNGIGTREFAEQFTKAIGDTSEFSDINLSVNGIQVYSYPPQKAAKPSERISQQFSQTDATADGNSLTLEATLYTVKLEKLHSNAILSFMFALIGTLVSVAALFICKDAVPESADTESKLQKELSEIRELRKKLAEEQMKKEEPEGTIFDDSINEVNEQYDEIIDDDDFDEDDEAEETVAEDESAEEEEETLCEEEPAHQEAEDESTAEADESPASGAEESAVGQEPQESPEEDAPAEPAQTEAEEMPSEKAAQEEPETEQGTAGAEEEHAETGPETEETEQDEHEPHEEQTVPEAEAAAAPTTTAVAETEIGAGESYDDSPAQETQPAEAAFESQPEEPEAENDGEELPDEFIKDLGDQLRQNRYKEISLAMVKMTDFCLDEETSTDKTQEILAIIKETFGAEAEVYEYALDTIAIVLNGVDIDTTLSQCETILPAIAEIIGNKNDAIFIGISAMNYRAIPADRLIVEAKGALEHAESDTANPIVAFKANPERYKQEIGDEINV